RELMLIAVFSDRNATDQLHDEVGPARLRSAAIEDVSDVRMIHQSERLPLRFEAGDDLARIHAGLEDLQRDAAAHRLLLLGHEDHAEAALADLLQELVRANDGAGAFADRLIDGGEGRWSAGPGVDAAQAVMGGQQRLDLRP